MTVYVRKTFVPQSSRPNVSAVLDVILRDGAASHCAILHTSWNSKAHRMYGLQHLPH